MAGNHLFIDGEYLRCAYEHSLTEVVPKGEVTFDNFDFEALKTFAGASKIYFYDAVHEGDADATSREAFLESIQHVSALHVRTGSVRPGKRGRPRQQKQVDVALTVDCLTQTFHKSVDTLTLVLGDLDFLPLVEVLVHQGAFVKILYQKKSASKDLLDAADVASELTLDVLWDLSSAAFKEKCPRPRRGQLPSSGLRRVCEGTMEGKPVTLYESPDPSWVILADYYSTQFQQPMVNGFLSRSRQVLETYLAVVGKPVTWRI